IEFDASEYFKFANWIFANIIISIYIIFIYISVKYKNRIITCLGTFSLQTKAVLNEILQNDRESPRMKQFHEKLKLQPIPSIYIEIEPRERFVDLVLVEIDSRTGELIPNSEKDPTKWGDWQNGGRVSDF
ncbi:uncharacterized protein LOC105433761, partial [Pogonomyrmex barbatus]|uniref:Uncharacterized protein LOC105433761 n=1 Tax=Pogonomyrmex barbatus TaxID=144034 RepID=A0A6I9WVV5_9HYME